jgi:choline kinase
MRCLAIIAAGNSKRMGGIPKALSFVDGIPNLENTLLKVTDIDIFDKIFVISNKTNYKDFMHVIDMCKSKHNINIVECISIESGRGCGHAVMETMNQLISLNLSELTICWGDVYFRDGKIFREIVEKGLICPNFIMPVVFENNPYVWIEELRPDDVKDKNIKWANFSKRGETAECGYHDQSLFRFNFMSIYNALKTMHNVLNKNGVYYSENKEMIFLDVLRYLHNCEKHAAYYVTEYQTFGYNTETELDELNEYLKTDD